MNEPKEIDVFNRHERFSKLKVIGISLLIAVVIITALYFFAKTLFTYTVDYESAWLLANDNGFATIDVDGYIHLLVQPAKEFAVAYNKEDTPVEMEIHEFCERCEKMINDDNIRFMIFPTDKDAWVISTESLLNDLTEELERVE